MKVQFIVLGLILATARFSAAEQNRYDNYRVVRVIPKDENQLNFLKELHELNEFSFWKYSGRINQSVDIMVPPHKRLQLDEILQEAGLESTITIQNVQQLISNERRSSGKKEGKALSWDEYHSLEELHDWLESLTSNPQITIVSAGESYEGRDIKGIQITHGSNLPGVIIESGIHAREWIGPAATSWIIDQILNSPSDSILKQYNYLYFPSVNPDGYAFTWSKDRVWRKTRQPYKAGLITCYGADPNRNWDNHWMEGGSSNQPCTETFAGSKAFSEPETKNLANYFTSVASKNDIYIGFHSYGQYLMYPWGYTGTDTPMEKTWKRIGDLAAADLKAVHGKEFAVGSIYDTIYQASGSSLEWYYGSFNSTLTYVFECRDEGQYGFVLPADQIIPTGEEHLAAITRFLTEYQKL